MKVYKLSFVNAITLISFGLWGYIDVNFSPTALIPVIFGIIILLLNPGLKKENPMVFLGVSTIFEFGLWRSRPII